MDYSDIFNEENNKNLHLRYISLELEIAEETLLGTTKCQGEKVSDVIINIWGYDNEVAEEIITTESGEFKLENIPDGKYALSLYSEEYSTMGDVDIIINNGNISKVESVYEVGCSENDSIIYGRVLGLNSAPSADEIVSLYKIIHSENGYSNLYPIKASFTNKHGQYIFEHIGIGSYRISSKLS